MSEIKYAKIINNETKQCDVGLGNNAAYYKSIGMTEMPVKQSYNGEWYIAGSEPEKPTEVKATEIRQLRNTYLQKYVDPIQLIIRWNTLSEAEQLLYTDYRQYLLNIPQTQAFPNTTVLTFDEWKTQPVPNESVSAVDDTKTKSLL